LSPSLSLSHPLFPPLAIWHMLTRGRASNYDWRSCLNPSRPASPSRSRRRSPFSPSPFRREGAFFVISGIRCPPNVKILLPKSPNPRCVFRGRVDFRLSGKATRGEIPPIRPRGRGWAGWLWPAMLGLQMTVVGRTRSRHFNRRVVGVGEECDVDRRRRGEDLTAGIFGRWREKRL